MTKLADNYRQLLTDDSNASLPLIAYYPVERSVLDIPLQIRGKHSFTQIEGYDSSLNRGVDFRRFFEWFREREDIENEEQNRSSSRVITEYIEDFAKVEDMVFGNKERLDSLDKEDIESVLQKFERINRFSTSLKKIEYEHQDKQLNAVRTAITAFMPNLSNIRVQRKPRLHMAVDKNGQPLNVMQLSQGEKSLMALVGDIARRLAMMNPALDDPLQGDGIILIDEVDMHLHPSWQRNLVPRFTATFPNCQIILSTHSPLVISDQKGILVYLLSDGEIGALPPLYGADVNTVLLEAMDTDVRNPDINGKLNDLLDAIHDGDVNNAKMLMQALGRELPAGNMELAKARLLLRKKELQLAKNK